MRDPNVKVAYVRHQVRVGRADLGHQLGATGAHPQFRREQRPILGTNKVYIKMTGRNHLTTTCEGSLHHLPLLVDIYFTAVLVVTMASSSVSIDQGFPNFIHVTVYHLQL